ncbi:MAG: hypothetical protein WCJ64_12185 [Rhodospirillaceae bacterium]
MSANVELTVFTNKRGRLSKSLSVDAVGNLVKEPMGSLFEGTAQRYRLPNGAKSLAELLDKMQAPHALALGRVRADIPDKSPITIKGREYEGAITRTPNNILYEPGAPAYMLVDLDTKGCPPEIVARLKAEGLVSLLAGIVPAIASAARVQRASTSAGLYRTDTQQKFTDSEGQHLYILVADGADIPRALAVLFKRVWLAGLGWIALSKSGATLKRGVIDAAVDAPERLVFEGAPEIKAPLAQDTAARKAIVTVGKALDTAETLPDLDAEEEAEFERLVKAAKAKIAPEAVRVEREYKNKEAEKAAKERDIPVEKARTLVEKRMGGVLMGSDTIRFAYRASATVAEVLSDPESFNGQACADPVEGPEYGRTTASVFLNVGTGKPMINSFAHGGMTYRLQHDAGSVRKRLEVAGETAATIVVALLADTDLDATEEDELIRLAAGLSGRGLRPLQKDLTGAKAKKAADEKAAKRAHLMEAATGRPVVVVRGGRLHEAVEQMDDAFAALEEPAVFQRNGLVRVIPVTASTATEDGIKLIPGTNRIKDLQEGDGRVIAMKHMEFQAIDEMGDPYPVDAPTDYVNAWRAMGAWKAPALRAISPCPIMRHDGSLEERGGYDRESMLFYGGGLKLNIPSKPDRTDALEALMVLLAPFEEFPLVTKGKPLKEDIDTAVLLSAIFSLALRTQLKTSPLHGVLARTSRTGKGLLLEGICTLVTGANAVTLPPNEGSTDEQIAEEDRKRFTAL